MARKGEIIEPEYVGELPPKRKRERWYGQLSPLLERKRGWYLIRVMESPEQAWSAQANLSSRQIKIPDPRGNWIFASRDSSVYALYGGPELPTPPRRRPKRKIVRKRKEVEA